MDETDAVFATARRASLMASEQDPGFAAEVPAFVNEIRRIFTHEEIRIYLDDPDDESKANLGSRIP